VISRVAGDRLEPRILRQLGEFNRSILVRAFERGDRGLLVAESILDQRDAER
jgi:hypothetical protein